MTKNTGSGRLRKITDSGQLSAWRAALARAKREQRSNRWKRRRGISTVTTSGMIRVRRPPGEASGPETTRHGDKDCQP